MSGGVDSSVAAVMLLEQGYEVIGATMRLWEPQCTENCNECKNQAIEDAKKVCEKLQIPHYIIDSRDIFKQKVIDKFINEYENNKTPNPCVECNKYLKFGEFYKKAQELQCDYISTGHYAKIEYSEKYNMKVIKKADEEKKDQTYFLYYMPKEEIEHVLFPLQNKVSKEEIRKIAEENNLITAHKKESQEICFIPDNDYQKFLKQYSKKQLKTGNIVLKTGEVLGKHNGLSSYTIGQRKGLGVSYKEPLYVIKLDGKNNQVIVGTEKDLYSNELFAIEINWLTMNKLEGKLQLKAKIRYRSKEAECTVIPVEEDKVKVVFKEPQRAITPGQSVVFYDDDILIGGGKII